MNTISYKKRLMSNFIDLLSVCVLSVPFSFSMILFQLRTEFYMASFSVIEIVLFCRGFAYPSVGMKVCQVGVVGSDGNAVTVIRWFLRNVFFCFWPFEVLSNLFHRSIVDTISKTNLVMESTLTQESISTKSKVAGTLCVVVLVTCMNYCIYMYLSSFEAFQLLYSL